jgi:hypothetical protein
MKSHTTDVMSRLGAIDPARDTAIDATERAQLWQLIVASLAGSSALARRRTRLLRLTLVIPAVLVLSAGALGASGVIRIGAPAEPIKGYSASLRGGDLVNGTVRLLPVTAPSPGGGPPWGMRVFSTKSGEGCVEVGRLLGGKLAAIDQENASRDDGLIHAFVLDSTFGARQPICEERVHGNPR